MSIAPLRLVHDGLNHSCNKSPDKIVAIIEEREYSYAQLEEHSSRLSHYLISRGFLRGDRIAVYMDNTWFCIISIFGILKAGGVFLVINPQTKMSKLEYILNDSEAKFLLTDWHLKDIFLPVVENNIYLNGVVCSGNFTFKSTKEQPSIESFNSALLEAYDAKSITTIIPNDLCALIYTSGSTGNPKGVMHTHQSMTYAISSISQYLRISSSDRIINFLPFAFDYGLYQLLMTIWLGATLILERSFTYPGEILKNVDKYHVTVFPGVPTVYSRLLSMHANKPLCLPSVKRVTNTAAALSPEFIPKLKQIFPSALIYKMYGLTECKRVCYLEPELIDKYPLSVGKAMPGTEVFLLSPDGFPVKPGQNGILHVRGPHIMKGYWKQPKLSKNMLKPAEIPNEYILCTHDWFRMDDNGFLYFVGRKDDIIKSRGEKISPVEVENVLLSIKGIYSAAVIGVYDDLLGQAVKAFVTIDKKSGLQEKLIKYHCTLKLENFMVPKEIVIVKELRRSLNGKIDKKRLLEG